VERIFRALTEIDQNGRAARRPLTFEALIAETGHSEAEVRTVVNQFRAPDCSFLVAGAQELSAGDVIDIGHEALIRNWRRIVDHSCERTGWLYDEERAGGDWRTLVRLAETNQIASQQWIANWEALQPTEAWTERYGNKRQAVEHLISRSRRALLQQERRRKARKVRERRLKQTAAAAVLLLLVTATVAAVWFMRQKNELGATVGRLLAATALQQIGSAADYEGQRRLAALAVEAWRRAPSDAAVQVAGTVERGWQYLRVQSLESVTAAEFSPDSRWLAVATNDGKVRLLDPAAHQVRAAFDHDGRVNRMRFTRDGRWLLTSIGTWWFGMESIRLTEVGTWRRYHSRDERVMAFDVSLDGRQAAVGTRDGVVRIVDIPSFAERELVRLQFPVLSLSFSPDSQWLAISSVDLPAPGSVSGTALTRPRGQAFLIGLPDGADRRLLEDGPGVTALAFDPKGQWLALGRNDGVLRVVDIPSGQERRKVEFGRFIAALSASKEGDRLAITISEFGSNAAGVARVYRARDWAEERAVLTGQRIFPQATALSPDASTIAVGDASGAVQLVDIASGDELARIKHQAIVTSVRFSPDGRWLATAGDDHTARLIQVPRGSQRTGEQAIAGLCQLNGENFSMAEWRQIFGDEPWRASCESWANPGDVAAAKQPTGRQASAAAVPPRGAGPPP
jgi:WD40 repeat protein